MSNTATKIAVQLLLLTPIWMMNMANAGPAKVARIWHGRTTNSKTAEYTKYLGQAIRKFTTIPGNLGYQMLRERVGDETHFTVISYWRSRDDVKSYAGQDIRRTRHLPRDPEFLISPEDTVMNYDIVIEAGR